MSLRAFLVGFVVIYMLYPLRNEVVAFTKKYLVRDKTSVSDEFNRLTK